MKRYHLLLLTVALLVAPFTLVAGVSPVAAHAGGTPQVINEPVGGYVISVWTRPDPLRVGTMHVTVTLAEAVQRSDGRVQPGEPVLNQDMELFGRNDSGATLPALSLQQVDGAQLFYEVDFEVPAQGEWTFDLVVNQDGRIQFSQQVLPPTRINLPVVGGLGVAIIVGAWLLLQRRQESA